MTTLQDIISSFEELEPADRLEWLIDFGNSLPELPEIYRAERDAGLHIVHECQAPVFFKVEVSNGALAIFADVPKEAPIARGFVSVLKTAFDGLPETSLQDAPEDMLVALRIKELLGMQRKRGLTAIYSSLHEQAHG